MGTADSAKIDLRFAELAIEGAVESARAALSTASRIANSDTNDEQTYAPSICRARRLRRKAAMARTARQLVDQVPVEAPLAALEAHCSGPPKAQGGMS